MWRLFKEAFKSIRKNKVVIIGLSFLVFIVSIIFTVLYDVKVIMTKQVNNYKKISHLHDVTVDLSIPNQGSLYKNGYTNNGKFNDNKNFESPNFYTLSKENIDKALNDEKFKNDPNFKKMINDLKSKEDVYISINNDSNFICLSDLNGFGNLEAYKKYYIEKDSIIDLFNIYAISKEINQNSDNYVSFNLEQWANDLNKDFASFQFKNSTNAKPITVNLYEKDNARIVPKKKFLEKNIDAIVTFDKTYTLKDILSLSTQEVAGNTHYFATKISSLFINLEGEDKDKVEATFDFTKGMEWINSKKGIKLDTEILMKNLDFEKYKNNNGEEVEYIYENKTFDKNKAEKLLNINASTTTYEINQEFKASFNLQLFNLSQEQLKIKNIQEKITLEQDKEYSIPYSWIFKRNTKTEFGRWLYETTFNSEQNLENPEQQNKDRWTGEYFAFMENILKTLNNPKASDKDKEKANILKNEFWKFSYWKKYKIVELTPYTKKEGNVALDYEKKKSKTLTSYITEEFNNFLMNQLLLTNAENISKTMLDWEKTNPEGTLKKDQDLYNQFNNQKILSDKLALLKNYVNSLTKDKIVQDIKNRIAQNVKKPEDYIGIRETITVEGLDQNSNKKIFHFINIGDKDQRIQGIQINIGKLYDEYSNPTKIYGWNIEEFSKSPQLDPIIASQLIKAFDESLFTDPKYIDPEFYYGTLYDNHYQENALIKRNQTKFLKLTRYFEKNNVGTWPGQLSDNEDKTNIYVALLNGRFKLAYKLANENKWINYLNSKELNNDLTITELKKWLIKKKLTIRTKFINTTEGWIKKDNIFKNILYIPIYYQAPKSDIIQRIFVENSITPFMEYLEKYLINSDLVKNEFISIEQVYEIVKSATKVLNNHKFYNSLLNSQIDTKTLTKIIIDLVYELSHNQNGDLIKSILDKLLFRSSKLIEIQVGNNKKQEYLIKELTKLFNFFSSVFKVDLEQIISPTEIVKISEDPIVVVDGLRDLIKSVDFKQFSKFAKEWIDKYLEKKPEEKEFINPLNNIKEKGLFEYQISKDNIIFWILNSIDEKKLKESLKTLINNIDFNTLFNLEPTNNNSILNRIINQMLLNGHENIKNIFKKLDANHDGKYTNIKEALNRIIKNFDLKIFNKNITKWISSNIENSNNYIFVDKIETINYIESKTGKVKQIVKTYLINEIKDEYYIFAFFHAMFEIPGSDKEFKKNISKLFNLSNKGKKITLGSLGEINLPSEDSEKLSILDLLKLTNIKLKNLDKTNIFNNVWFIQEEFIKVYEWINSSSKLKFEDLPLKTVDSHLAFKKMFNIFTNEELNNKKEYLTKNIKSIIDFINQLKITNTVNNEDKTIADWFKYLDSWNKNTNSEYWSILKTTIENFIPSDIDNKDFGSSNLMLISFWIEALTNSNFTNQNEAINFVNDLLNLSIKQDIKEILNSKDLEDSSTNNQKFHNKTKLGITYGMAFIQKSYKKLFAKHNNEYINISIKNLINKYPKSKNWINNNGLEITGNLAYICANAELVEGLYSDHETYGPYYFMVKSLINGYLSTPEFWNSKQFINEIVGLNLSTRIFNYLGMNIAISNPIMLKIFPQLILYYLTDTSLNSSLNSTNLQYLIDFKLINFEDLAKDKNNYLEYIQKDFEITKIRKKYLSNENNSKIYLDEKDLNTKKTLKFDKNFFDLFNVDGDNTFFGIDIPKLILGATGSIIENVLHKEISYTSPLSYVAKVSHAYLIKNNKAIYDGKIERFTNPIQIENFIQSIDQKFVLDVNGIKFLIIGSDMVADYLYPVVDENNLQTSVENQALVFLNAEGFSRIKSGYAANAIKNYLLIKCPDKNTKDFIEDINHIVSKHAPGDKIKRVYASEELDPINPERSLRITTINKMIYMVNLITTLTIVFFIALITISTIFIINRYVRSKYKVLGILVAQGYSPLQIVFSFTVFAMFTCILGGVFGYIIGFRLQVLFMNIFNSYWTLPLETVSFNFRSMLLTVFVPYVGMSVLIMIVALINLRFKPIDLISGNAEIRNFSIKKKFEKVIRKKNIKKKFSISLIFNGIGKLLSFSASIVLVAITSIFSLASSAIFKNTLNDTYQHRYYNFKTDLETPTTESGQYKMFFNTKNEGLENNLYVPIGESNEMLREQGDYFKPGFSSIINANDKNGKLSHNAKDGHTLTQFSVNIIISSGVSIDPWQTTYNSMPDTQKAKINLIRDKVAAELIAAQDGQIDQAKPGYIKRFITPFYHNETYDINYLNLHNGEENYWTFIWVSESELNTNSSLKNKTIFEQNRYFIEHLGNYEKAEYFKYFKNSNVKDSKFVYVTYDSKGNEEYREVKTKDDNNTSSDIRDKYRQFLVDGYRKIGEIIQIYNKLDKQEQINVSQQKKEYNLAQISTKILNEINHPNNFNKNNIKIENDYFITFGGVYLNEEVDEIYSYAKAKIDNSLQIDTIYGHLENSKYVKFVDKNQNDLLKKLYEFNDNNIYPIIINNTIAHKEKLKINDVIEVEITNHVDRYKEKIEAIINNKPNKSHKHKFKIIGISNTHIDKEFITRKDIIDKIIGLNKLVSNQNHETIPFNGVMTIDKAPQQLIGSTSLYSNSNYWSGNDSFNFESMSDSELQNVFDFIFKPRTNFSGISNGGIMSKNDFSNDQIMKFISHNPNAVFDQSAYDSIKNTNSKNVLLNYADIYNNTMYIALGTSVYAKSIEVGFIDQISSVVETIINIIIAISFTISIILLVIISTIIITENEKNIAIWSILGYKQREKIGMFFGIFIPFILLALLISIPITYGIIELFKNFIVAKQMIHLPIYLSATHVFSAIIVIFSIFIATSFLVWLSINKMKPIDLLKERD